MARKSNKINEELMYNSNKIIHKFDMNYSSFLYHILCRTHTKKKCKNPYNFNHYPLHKDKYNFLSCSSPYFSPKNVTHKHPPKANDL